MELKNPLAKEKCKACDGLTICIVCDGTGWDDMHDEIRKCIACNGSGKCVGCKGTGWRYALTQR